MGIFEDYQLIQKLDVGDGEARFEIKRVQHDHLIDVETNQIHEFKIQQLQKLIEEIADEKGLSLPNIGWKFMGANMVARLAGVTKSRFIRLSQPASFRLA